MSQPIELFLVKTSTQPNLNWSWVWCKIGNFCRLLNYWPDKFTKYHFWCICLSNICVKIPPNNYEITLIIVFRRVIHLISQNTDSGIYKMHICEVFFLNYITLLQPLALIFRVYGGRWLRRSWIIVQSKSHQLKLFWSWSWDVTTI